MVKNNQPGTEMLNGALDMMILRALVGGHAHRHTVAKVIERSSEDLLEEEQGSLYPAPHRPEGRKKLVRERVLWRQRTQTIGLVIGEQGGAQ
jgi:PadR family transcriptional regulator PadR